MVTEACFNDANFILICDSLAAQDESLKIIITKYGYPPLWKRAASFETLIHIILEQQVSLAAALAALNKLRQKIKEVTPQNVLALSNEDLKDCYFSRQKIIYAKHVASEIYNGNLDLDGLSTLDNDAIRARLTKLKGIGNWSVDVYLMMVLQRCDIFPLGDIALMTSIKEIKNLPRESNKEISATIAAAWKPYQTIAAFILWHAYLSKRKR